MSPLLFIAATLGLIFFGVPIAYSLGLASVSFLMISGIPPVSFVQHLSGGINSFTILALPFFILAGQLMNLGGITDRIVRFANSLVGHIEGGLGHASILGSMVFVRISGSAAASAGALGTVQLTALRKNGYDTSFSVALISAAMTIGPIIPPSVILVVYGIAAGVPIGNLFVGGIVPGVLMGFGLMGYVAWRARGNGLPRFHERFDGGEVADSLKGAFWALLTPLIVIGGIIGGILTATEAGAIAAIYAFLVGRFVYGELTIAGMVESLVNTMVMSAAILLIMGMSNSFGWVMAFERIPSMAAEAIRGISENRYVILCVLMGFYLVLGCLLEAIAIVVMTIPVVFPIITSLGVDPIHFGVILAVNMSIGTITPPLGLVIYVMTDIAGIKMGTFARAIVPFLAILVAMLLVLTLVPQLTTALPEWIF